MIFFRRSRMLGLTCLLLLTPFIWLTAQSPAQEKSDQVFDEAFAEVRGSFQSFQFDQTQSLARDLIKKVDSGEIDSGNSTDYLFFTKYLEAKSNYWLGNLAKSKVLYQEMDTAGISPRFRIIYHCGAALNSWELSDYEASTAHTLAARTIANQSQDQSMAVYNDFARAILYSHLGDLDLSDFHFTRAADSSSLTNKAILSYFKFRNQYHNQELPLSEIQAFVSTYDGQLGYLEELFQLQILRTLIDQGDYNLARKQVYKLNSDLDVFSRVAFFKYYLLGELELHQGNESAAINHLKAMLLVQEEITPFKALRAHRSLATAYDQLGIDSAAQHHELLSAKFEAKEKESVESYTLVKNVLDFELEQGQKESEAVAMAMDMQGTQGSKLWLLLLLLPALAWVFKRFQQKSKTPEEATIEVPVIEKVDPSTFDDDQLKMLISASHPKLTKNDLAHALFLIRRKSIKESAALLSVSDSAVMKGRSRLKKKLQLDEQTDLKEFLTESITS